MREPELSKAILTAWASVANSATLLPGGLHEFRAEGDNVPYDSSGKKAEVYGTLLITENGIKRQTNGGVVREHIATISVKHNEGLTACASIIEAMANRTSGIPSLVSTLDNSGNVIDMWPHDSKGGQTEMQRRGKIITDAAIAWRIESGWAY